MNTAATRRLPTWKSLPERIRFAPQAVSIPFPPPCVILGVKDRSIVFAHLADVFVPPKASGPRTMRKRANCMRIHLPTPARQNMPLVKSRAHLKPASSGKTSPKRTGGLTSANPSRHMRCRHISPGDDSRAAICSPPTRDRPGFIQSNRKVEFQVAIVHMPCRERKWTSRLRGLRGSTNCGFRLDQPV